MLQIVLIGIGAGLLAVGVRHPSFMGWLKFATIIVGFLFGMWRLFMR
ncbi:hypothetical protein [Plastoroseomonas hellenica]|nr:hypothetical protein [Plastoroseomonas hellenica]MBR0646623.1 hypothetical protein [Plastoroseomonas hellenica]